MTNNKTQLINHISRLEGQLASVKNELQQENPDCVKASTTLLSASRSFAGLRQTFTESFLVKHFVPQVKESDKEMFDKLIAIIKG